MKFSAIGPVVPAAWLFMILMSAGHFNTVTCAVECVTCSYTFAGMDGSTDIECVTDVYNFTQTSEANCSSNVCTVKAVYSRDYKRLNSLHRGCGTAAADKCDEPNIIIPTCEVTCTTPRCNDQHGNLWATKQNSGSRLVKDVQNIFCLIFVARLMR